MKLKRECILQEYGRPLCQRMVDMWEVACIHYINSLFQHAKQTEKKSWISTQITPKSSRLFLVSGVSFQKFMND